MSAQAYINRKRVLAEASLLKTVYPGRVEYTNKLSATINCNSNFNNIDYYDICECKFNGRGNPPVRPLPPTPPIVCINTLSGGGSNTIGYIIYDGNCYSSCSILTGGNSNTQINCVNSTIQSIIYDGGSSGTNSLVILSGNL
jgi:hypothetical protein